VSLAITEAVMFKIPEQIVVQVRMATLIFATIAATISVN